MILFPQIMHRGPPFPNPFYPVAASILVERMQKQNALHHDGRGVDVDLFLDRHVLAGLNDGLPPSLCRRITVQVCNFA